MEQVIDAETLVRLPTSASPHFIPKIAEPYRAGSSTAWKRLSEVKLDPIILARNALITAKSCDAAAPIDILRTRVVKHMRRDGMRRLAITAPTDACGKSTLIGNLALSLARRQDLKIIVFDFDLRNPSLIHKFGLADIGPRFSALSGTRRNFDSTCLRVGTNLGLSLNSTVPSNPAELLGAVRSRDLIEQIERDFNPDIMLFDLPSLLPSDDAHAALEIMDQTLIVAMADVTTEAEINHAHQITAEQGKSLGVILNKCRFPAQTKPAQRPTFWHPFRKTS